MKTLKRLLNLTKRLINLFTKAEPVIYLEESEILATWEKTRSQYLRLHPEYTDVINNANLPKIVLAKKKKLNRKYGVCLGVYLPGGKILLPKSGVCNRTLSHEMVHYCQDLTNNLSMAKDTKEAVRDWVEYLKDKPDEMEAYAIGAVTSGDYNSNILKALSFYGYHIAVDMGNRKKYIEKIK